MDVGIVKSGKNELAVRIDYACVRPCDLPDFRGRSNRDNSIAVNRNRLGSSMRWIHRVDHAVNYDEVSRKGLLLWRLRKAH
jgi:hypothetical protein